MRKRLVGYALSGSLMFVAMGAGLLCPVPAEAHHGKTFLIVETYELPHPREAYFFSTLDFVRHRAGRTLAASPALLLGISPRFAVELHGHAQRSRSSVEASHGDEHGEHEGEESGQALRRFSSVGHGQAEGNTPFRYESTALALRYQLTPSASRALWRLALTTEFESAHLDDGHNRWEGRLVIAHPHGKSDFTFNLIGEREQGSEEGVEFGYAVGFRPDVTRRWGWGVEAQGQFKSHSSHEVLLGIYGDVSERLNVKVGAGTGLGPDRARLTLRVGVVLRL